MIAKIFANKGAIFILKITLYINITKRLCKYILLIEFCITTFYILLYSLTTLSEIYKFNVKPQQLQTLLVFAVQGKSIWVITQNDTF